MEITIKKENDITVVGFSGKLDSNTSPEAESRMKALLEEGPGKLLINLTDTKYVSSAGLRIFMLLAKSMKTTDGIFKLCCPNDIVKEVLNISGCCTIMDVKETEEEAIAEFG